MAEDRVELPGSRQPPIPNARVGEPVDPNLRITVSIEVRPFSARLELPAYNVVHEQTALTPAPVPSISVGLQLALGTWYCLNERKFGRDAVRILSAKAALGR